jgi:DNA-binding SARP family transcriptional activator/Tfp pilus assembly protein PilF
MGLAETAYKRRVDFGVLGPVRVREGHRELPAGSGRERFVLAMLLLNAGHQVPADQLIQALWGEPPPSAKAQLHNAISKWRRRLAGHAKGSGELIVTRPLGYELRLGPHRLDVGEFRRLAADGRQAARRGDHEAAVSALAEALSWWRGPALADIADELVAATRQALEEERLAAAEARLESELVLGRHQDVLATVSGLIDAHPYREWLYQAQMRALVGSGRRADALDVYRRLYRRLGAELGIEPGPSLRELEQRILRGEPPAEPVQPAQPVVPRQLPPVTGALTGRGKLIAEIRAELLRDDPQPPVGVLVGPGGIGKTTLALAAGHRLAADFPSGQLYADLRGSQREPADPHIVIGRFLRALGVDGQSLPDDREERVAMYRSQLAGRRLLLVLDDAGSERQVRPLLPGAAGCAVLICSRRQLRALVGTGRWTVPALAAADASLLLARVVGQERAAAEPAQVAAVVDLCGGLPLAVSIAAARLAARPDWTVAQLRQRLAEERGRLDELTVGDLDVRASIALSYEALDPTQRQLLRRLGLLAAPDWPAWVAGELLAAPAAAVIDQLVDVHLVEPRGQDTAGNPATAGGAGNPTTAGQHRFRLHDLVAEFARERAAEEDADADCRQALARMLRGWFGLATVADELIGHGLVAAAGLPAPPPPAAAEPAARQAPRDWFDIERASLIAAVDHACRIGDAELAGGLALRLSGFLALRAHYDDWERTLRAATARVREHDLPELLLRLLGALCVVCRSRSRNLELAELAAEEQALANRLGDRQREIGALGNAGWAARKLGRLAQARDILERAVDACDADTPNRLRSRALTGLAMLNREMGQPASALRVAEQALAIERQEGSPRIIAICLLNYAATLMENGRFEDSERALAEAMTLINRIGDDENYTTNERLLGELNVRRGRWAVAEELLNRSVHACRARGDVPGEADVLGIVGDLAIARGRPQQALEPLQSSLTLWRRLDAPVEVARIHARLELACAATGRPTAAARHRREYRAALADLELDEACLRLFVLELPDGNRQHSH